MHAIFQLHYLQVSSSGYHGLSSHLKTAIWHFRTIAQFLNCEQKLCHYIYIYIYIYIESVGCSTCCSFTYFEVQTRLGISNMDEEVLMLLSCWHEDLPSNCIGPSGPPLPHPLSPSALRLRSVILYHGNPVSYIPIVCTYKPVTITY